MRSRLLPSLLQTRKLFHEYFKPPINNVITYLQLKQAKSFSSNNPKGPGDIKDVQGSSHNLPGSINYTHKPFEDEDADIILDVSENQGTINLDDLKSHEEYYNPYEGINLERKLEIEQSCATNTIYRTLVMDIYLVHWSPQCLSAEK